MGKQQKQIVYRTKSEIREFFRTQRVVYIERTRVQWKPLLSMRLDQSDYYKANEEEFKTICRLYSDSIENSRMAPVYIKKIDDNIGFGVFVAEDIRKGDFIGEYAGVVQVSGKNSGRKLEEGGYESDFSWYYLDDLKDGPTLEISGRLEGNEMRFINHGVGPNLDVEHTLHSGQWVIFFKAKFDIKKNTQLLISYGEAYWEDGCREMVK